jgi:hypothetical protein
MYWPKAGLELMRKQAARSCPLTSLSTCWREQVNWNRKNHLQLKEQPLNTKPKKKRWFQLLFSVFSVLSFSRCLAAKKVWWCKLKMIAYTI